MPVTTAGAPMAEFYRGWKRKTGFVTLLMACVFDAGWVRSLSHDDSLWFSHNNAFYRFRNADESMSCDRIDSMTPAPEWGYFHGVNRGRDSWDGFEVDAFVAVVLAAVVAFANNILDESKIH